MRKSALLISAAVLAVCLPNLASAAPAAPADPNANSKKFVSDWVSQIFVPAQSLAPKPVAAAPVKKAGKKKTAKVKGNKKT